MYKVTAVDNKGFQVYLAWIEAETQAEAIERAKLYVINKYSRIYAIEA